MCVEDRLVSITANEAAVLSMLRTCLGGRAPYVRFSGYGSRTAAYTYYQSYTLTHVCMYERMCVYARINVDRDRQ
jgi:hypothetical protein